MLSGIAGLAEHRGTDLVKMEPDGGHDLPVALRGGLDSQRPQQRGGRLAGVPALTESGV